MNSSRRHFVLAAIGICLTVAAGSSALFSRAAALENRALRELLESDSRVLAEPQQAVTEWTDKFVLFHRVTTPMRQSDSPESLTARHDELLRAFLETYPVEK